MSTMSNAFLKKYPIKNTEEFRAEIEALLKIQDVF